MTAFAVANGSCRRRSTRMMADATYRRNITTALACLLGCAAALACAAPKAVRASYNGYVNGMAIGVISEHFEADFRGYRIVSDTKLIGLLAFVQRQPLKFSSTGELTRDGLRPLQFEARKSAGEQPQVTAEFDWVQGQVMLRHDGKAESLPVAPGTQDRLSIMYQFMFLPLERTRQVEFAMTNGRKLDRYRYRVTPEVELDTPLGRVKTLHLVKQRAPGDTVTEIWLSVQHRHFPVKLLIIEKDGRRYEQIIQSLEFRG